MQQRQESHRIAGCKPVHSQIAVVPGPLELAAQLLQITLQVTCERACAHGSRQIGREWTGWIIRDTDEERLFSLQAHGTDGWADVLAHVII